MVCLVDGLELLGVARRAERDGSYRYGYESVGNRTVGEGAHAGRERTPGLCFGYDAPDPVGGAERRAYGLVSDGDDPDEMLQLRAPTSGLGYRGQSFDAETGLVYLRNRYYEPSLGTFTQVDPARAGHNWFGYAGGDPVNRWDPMGLWEINWREGKAKPKQGEGLNQLYYDMKGRLTSEMSLVKFRQVMVDLNPGLISPPEYSVDYTVEYHIPPNLPTLADLGIEQEFVKDDLGPRANDDIKEFNMRKAKLSRVAIIKRYLSYVMKHGTEPNQGYWLSKEEHAYARSVVQTIARNDYSHEMIMTRLGTLQEQFEDMIGAMAACDAGNDVKKVTDVAGGIASDVVPKLVAKSVRGRAGIISFAIDTAMQANQYRLMAEVQSEAKEVRDMARALRIYIIPVWGVENISADGFYGETEVKRHAFVPYECLGLRMTTLCDTIAGAEASIRFMQDVRDKTYFVQQRLRENLDTRIRSRSGFVKVNKSKSKYLASQFMLYIRDIEESVKAED